MVEKDRQEGIQNKKLFTICTNGSEAILNIGGVDERYHIGEGVTVRIDRYLHLWWKLFDFDVGSFTMNGSVLHK